MPNFAVWWFPKSTCKYFPLLAKIENQQKTANHIGWRIEPSIWWGPNQLLIRGKISQKGREQEKSSPKYTTLNRGKKESYHQKAVKQFKIEDQILLPALASFIQYEHVYWHTICLPSNVNPRSCLLSDSMRECWRSTYVQKHGAKISYKRLFVTGH